MQFLAGVLSTLLNVVIVGVIAALLFLSVQDELDLGLEDAPLDSSPGVVIAAGDTPRTALVHLFEWRWDDVALECESVLGPAGFRAVQVSPPNEHRLVAGGPWWQRYQPVSYRLNSRSGDAEAFADMVQRCATAGVAVYADVVINHMTGPRFEDDPLWGTGSAGSRYELRQYPDFGPADFHQPDCPVDDYADRDKVQRCSLSGRADLDTEADRVQNRIGAYLNALQDLGVAGFRIDAAKHMAAGDLAGILARVRGSPDIYLAVRESSGEAVQGREYLGIGSVTEFDFGRRLAAALRSGNLVGLASLLPALGADDLLPTDRALVFIDSHDSQRGDGDELLAHADGALYDLANVFMLAWPYGTPRVMSSYRFADPSQGPPGDAAGATLPVHGSDGIGCGVGWLCEHRRPTVLGMVGFRNATEGAGLDSWWNDDTGGRIAFGRGERGFVVINNTDEPMRQWLRMGLPAGRYCNVLASRPVDGACAAMAAEPDQPAADSAGPAAEQGATGVLEVTVGKDKSATFAVPPRSAIAIHVGMASALGR